MSKKSEGIENLPLYRRVAARLEERITKRMKPGDRLEASSELADRYGVSVLTVNEALKILTARGFISRKQGVGTYVLKPIQTAGDKLDVALVLVVAAHRPRLSEELLKTVSQLSEMLEKDSVRYRTTVQFWEESPSLKKASEQNSKESEHCSLAFVLSSIAGFRREDLALEAEQVLINGQSEESTFLDWDRSLPQVISTFQQKGCQRVGVCLGNTHWLGWRTASPLLSKLDNAFKHQGLTLYRFQNPADLQPGDGALILTERDIFAVNKLPESTVAIRLQAAELGSIENTTALTYSTQEAARQFRRLIQAKLDAPEAVAAPGVVRLTLDTAEKSVADPQLELLM